MLSFPLIESLTIQTTVDFPKNHILRDDKGREQRIIPHQAPLRKFNLTKKIHIKKFSLCKKSTEI